MSTVFSLVFVVFCLFLFLFVLVDPAAIDVVQAAFRWLECKSNVSKVVFNRRCISSLPTTNFHILRNNICQFHLHFRARPVGSKSNAREEQMLFEIIISYTIIIYFIWLFSLFLSFSFSLTR